MKRKALFMSLSDKASHQQLIVMDGLKVDEIKTKNFVGILNGLFQGLEIKQPGTAADTTTAKSKSDKLKQVKKEVKQPTANDKFNFKTLIIIPATDKNLVYSARNLPRVKVIRADSLNVKDILNYDWLVLPEQSLAVFEQTYLK